MLTFSIRKKPHQFNKFARIEGPNKAIHNIKVKIHDAVSGMFLVTQNFYYGRLEIFSRVSSKNKLKGKRNLVHKKTKTSNLIYETK